VHVEIDTGTGERREERALEQIFRNPGQTKDKDVLPGILPLVQRLVDTLSICATHISTMQRKMGSDWDAAVQAIMTPADATLGVRGISPLKSLPP
jgi:hypothetical protein